jgi:hypothetical protein
MALVQPRSRLKSLMASWPAHGDELLLRAALAESSEARRAWDQWKSQFSLDEATWHDHKLLAVVAARLSQLDPEYDSLRRLQGLTKAQWSAAQVKLHAGLQALDILVAAQMPVILLKGVAFDLAAPSQQRRRLSGDLDIMVRRCDLHHALTLLGGRGWHKPDYTMADQQRYLEKHPGINLVHGNGDIDVHHQPVHLRWMSDRALGRFWQRARPVSFGGRDVLIPSEADLLCISASHGLRRDLKRNICHGAWAIDFHHVLSAPRAGLERLPAIAQELGVAIHVLSGLLFLRQALRAPVDAGLIAALDRRSHGLGGRLRYYVDTPAEGAAGKEVRRMIRRVMFARLIFINWCRRQFSQSTIFTSLARNHETRSDPLQT